MLFALSLPFGSTYRLFEQTACYPQVPPYPQDFVFDTREERYAICCGVAGFWSAPIHLILSRDRAWTSRLSHSSSGRWEIPTDYNGGGRLRPPRPAPTGKPDFPFPIPCDLEAATNLGLALIITAQFGRELLQRLNAPEA